VKYFLESLCVGLLFGLWSSAQTLEADHSPGNAASEPAGQKAQQDRKYKPAAKRDFLKNLTLDVVRNLGNEYGLGNMNSGVSNGLACPICSFRFPSARVRPAVPAFGGTVTWGLAGHRLELFARMGGLNAWRPDNIVIDAHRSTSFNDVWLLQSASGVRIALDRGKHLWLGAEAGYFQTLGADQRKWSAATVSLTYQFGQ
jgi:hypothetical protein